MEQALPLDQVQVGDAAYGEMGDSVAPSETACGGSRYGGGGQDHDCFVNLDSFQTGSLTQGVDVEIATPQRRHANGSKLE